ncbi:outer membrane beta-barrel protein [Polaribacter sp. KT25b]|uniref:outer membrane beta-barrel protein n=1 Tax=Polaribacter sp. KT25b TaxID=1855336 RepID=UPI0012FD6261|nr:outer membrane beta-barrel protein [Polaribacter sp. KT25b]
MKRALLLFSLFISISLFSQKFTLEGVLKDQYFDVLNGATVYLQSIKDSIPIAYGITNKKGEFSLPVNAGTDTKIIFNIAYLGYKPYVKNIDVPKGGELNMGDIILSNQIEELDVITIISRAPPVLIKKDTVEYNADSFKTLPNDKVEDLLKKLPGVDIDLDGVITVNGIEVSAINVDGMKFFGEQKGDIALKNLPSNVVNKVQVTDYKTDNQKFTGEESDSGTKEINFTIKKGKNRATFGDVKLGYGTDEKYQANANIFKLIDGKQIGLIAGTNNINLSKGFNSLPDTDTSNGYIESDFIGANYTKGKWNENRINGNYRYSAQSRDFDQVSHKETFLPNLNYITDSKNSSFTDSEGHTAGADLVFILKPKKNISTKKVRLSNKMDFKNSSKESGAIVDKDSYYNNGDLVSDFNSKNESTSLSNEFKNDFSVTSVLNNKADYFNINLGTDFSKDESDSKKYSENILTSSGETIVQNQVTTSDSNNSNISFNAFLSKELFTNFRLMPRYNATINSKKTENYIYDFDKTSEEYNNFNDLLSSDSKYVTTTLKPALKLRYQYKEFRFDVEGAYTNTYRNYEDELVTARDFKADFQYFTYSGRIRYKDINGYKNISLQYDQNVDLPSVSQLQPVEDVSDITHVVVGNPLLEPGVIHNVRFLYQNNLAYNNINISGNAKAQFVKNKIINSTTTDVDLNRFTTYSNIDGDYSYSGNFAVSKSYFSRKTNINLNVRFNASYKNSLSIQNEVKFTAKTTVLRPSFSFRYAYDNKIDVSTTYSYSKNKSVYDTDEFNDNSYFVQNLDLETNVFFLKNAFFSNRVSYRYNSRVGDEFDGDAIFWNAGLGVELWDNQATLSLVAYDMLGKNNGYRRSVTETYIQDVENKILEQYFMLTFTYKFGTFAGQKINVKGVKKGGRGRSRKKF